MSYCLYFKQWVINTDCCPLVVFWLENDLLEKLFFQKYIFHIWSAPLEALLYLWANAEIASAHHLLDFQARWKLCFPHSLPRLFLFLRVLLLLYVEDIVW